MSWDQLREEDGTNGFIHGLNSLSLSSLEYSEPLNAACMVSFFLFLAVYNFFFFVNFISIQPNQYLVLHESVIP